MNKMKHKKNSPLTFLLEGCIILFGGALVSVVLFGSRARGNYGKDSDIDVIIVLDKPQGHSTSQLKKDFLLRFEKRLDLHIFSKDEIVQNFNDYSPMFSTLLLGKKILFDKEMFFKSQFENFVKNMTSIDIKYCEGDQVWEMQKIARNLEVLR